MTSSYAPPGSYGRRSMPVCADRDAVEQPRMVHSSSEPLGVIVTHRRFGATFQLRFE
jgi:hypothetical protein